MATHATPPRAVMTRVRYTLALLMLVTACGGADEPPQPASVQAAGATTFSGVVATEITPAPAVVVRDASARPLAGIAVQFSVLTGGGSVSNTSATTDAQGQASSGGWTLGSVAGTQTLQAAVAGLAPVVFTATAAADAAVSIQVTGGDQTGVVGRALPVAPSVIVRDRHANAVAGATVSFTVTAGGGSIANATATTDSQGRASAGAWTLGTTAGSQTLRISVGELSPEIRATATHDVAASIVAAAGSGQTALTGANVAVAPAVFVRDQYGNAVPNTAVTFEVAGGGGSVTGAAAVTDASGRASVGSWRLGIVPGENVLRARAGTLSTTISATGTLPTGCAVAPFAIGVAISGTWQAGDCTSPGGRGANDPAGALYDQYELNLATQTEFRLELDGPQNRTMRVRRKATGEYVGLGLGSFFAPPTENPHVLRYVLEPGDYIVEVQAPAGASGAYTLRSALDPVTACRPITQTTVGVTIQARLDETTGCPSPVVAGTFEAWYVMILKTGDRLRITLTTDEMPPILVWRDDRLGPASPTLAVRSSPTPGTLVIEWTATFDTYHEIVIAKNGGPSVPYGNYTLKIERM
jgi:hypothetical protein